MIVHFQSPESRSAASSVTIGKLSLPVPVRLVSLRWTLTTDATVLNRYTKISILDGADNTLTIIQSAVVQIASTTRHHYMFPGSTTSWNHGETVTHLCPATIILQPEWSMNLIIFLAPAGDLISNVIAVWETL